uniref:Col_cuticle_N domain-containing protein n=1 Tax=Steinernema glaseri TaxID=37863 RepID=A0A1I8A3L4_9BILA
MRSERPLAEPCPEYHLQPVPKQSDDLDDELHITVAGRPEGQVASAEPGEVMNVSLLKKDRDEHAQLRRFAVVAVGVSTLAVVSVVISLPMLYSYLIVSAFFEEVVALLF